jgi:hypothetical protein
MFPVQLHGVFMQNAPVQRWQMLCALAADEQDPQKLLALIDEMNKLLEEERSRSKTANSAGLPMPGRDITE